METQTEIQEQEQFDRELAALEAEESAKLEQENIVLEDQQVEQPASAAIMERLADLQRQLAELKAAPAGTGSPTPVRPRVVSGRKYVLLTNKLATWGRVPRQQADIADLLARNFVPGEPATEEEVFDALIEHASEYESLVKSVQDPTYLFRYYRGLKNDGKHAGLIARNFLKVLG